MQDPREMFNTLNQAATDAVIHLRYDGTSRDLSMGLLDLGSDSTDAQIKLAVAQYLDVSLNNINELVLERHSTGNVTLRPQAVYG